MWEFRIKIKKFLAKIANYILKSKKRSARLNAAGFTNRTTKKYATTQRIGHKRMQVDKGIPLGIANIKGINRLIIRLIKNAIGFQKFIILKPPFIY